MRRMRKCAMAGGAVHATGCGKDLGTAVRPAAAAVGRRQGLVHDAPDGTCASPALGAAAETAVNLAASARRVVAGQGRTDVLVGKHVARTDDHRDKVPGELVTYATILSRTRKN